MVQRILVWLDIYEKEIGLFIWTVTLLFIVRGSGIILNNYAETAFLKRYGVEFMPIVTMLNALATVIIMGLMTVLIRRFPGPGLLAAMFAFCGCTIFVLRLLIPAGINLIYPLLFILKALYELLIAMLFWNLANDLFNTRQSKRLFPLISAGGVIGQIIGSFGTPLIARWFMLDNLLTAYLVISITGAMVVRSMMNRYPSMLVSSTARRDKKKGASTPSGISALLPVMRQSALLRIMLVLTFMPNVVIPIMNYQFNYAVDSQFATESAMLAFFSYFRGSLNIVSLVILLFVGRIYGRWGLPLALMFHPFNYVIAFIAFFFRFDAVSAIYARMSTNVIRTTINIPANAVIMGLFPDEFRSLVRPFLRGTVVRIALFIGSGLILASSPFFHPRHLSLVALPFVAIWAMAPFWLKNRYIPILLDLIKRDQLDLKSITDRDVGQLFRDRRIIDQLSQDFLSAAPRDIVWYAQLFRHNKTNNLDALILRRLPDMPTNKQIELLPLLSTSLPKNALPALKKMAEHGPAGLTLAVLRTINRQSTSILPLFDRRPYLQHPEAHVRGNALAGLYLLAPATYGRIIERWLDAARPDTRLAGVIAAGLTDNTAFVPALMRLVRDAQRPALLIACMEALHTIGPRDLNALARRFLSHADTNVRQAALTLFHIVDEQSLKTAIHMLTDTSPLVRATAVERIADAPFQDGSMLIKALNLPDRNTRKAIFDLIDRLNIRDLDIYRFARGRIEGAYKYLAEQEAVARLPQCPARDLLTSHLLQQGHNLVDDVLRVLDITDRSGRIHIIRQGLFAADSRKRANSQEALNDVVDRRLGRILIPLLDREDIGQALKSAGRWLQPPRFNHNAGSIYTHLLSRKDWLTVLLALTCLASDTFNAADQALLHKLTAHDNIYIRKLARRVLSGKKAAATTKERPMTAELSLPDVLLRLKKIEIFERLSVNELAAVAAITSESFFDQHTLVIREGEPGDTLYLVLEGEVAVMKKQQEKELELDRIGAGDYFGEMALFEDIPRSASIRTLSPCRMLMLNKHAFNEIVREYPQIALEICKVLSGRIRKLHQKITKGA